MITDDQRKFPPNSGQTTRGENYEDLTMGEKYTNQDFHPSVEGRVQGRKDSNAGNRVLIGLVSVRTGRRSDAQLLFIIAANLPADITQKSQRNGLP